MPVMTAAPLAVSDEQRASLERMARSTSLPHRTVVQATALLLAADGMATNEVARRCGTTNNSVRAWRQRFEVDGVEGVGRIAPGRGRKSWLPEGTVAEVVGITREEKPHDTSTHRPTRSLADRLGIGKDTVARIWPVHKLKPWKVDTFKLSNDRRGSLILETQGRVGSSPDNDGTGRHRQTAGSGKQDGKVYECRNQWWNRLKRETPART